METLVGLRFNTVVEGNILDRRLLDVLLVLELVAHCPVGVAVN